MQLSLCHRWEYVYYKHYTTLLIPTFLAFPFTSLTDVTWVKVLPDLLIFHQIQIITNVLRSKLQESEHSLKGRQLKHIWKRKMWIIIYQHNIMNFSHSYRSTKACTSRLVTIISGSWFTWKYTDFIVCFINYNNSQRFASCILLIALFKIVLP